MANNETAAPAILAIISKWLSMKKNILTDYFFIRNYWHYSLSKKYENNFKKNTLAGYVITCFGDEGKFSYIQSKYPKYSLSDKMVFKTFKNLKTKNKIYNWLYRGSDERQYNSAGINLNFGTLMRTKFLSYKEYHTSQDNLNITVNEKSILKSYKFIQKLIENFEKEIFPWSLIKCEPF